MTNPEKLALAIHETQAAAVSIANDITELLVTILKEYEGVSDKVFNLMIPYLPLLVTNEVKCLDNGRYRLQQLEDFSPEQKTFTV